MRTRQSQLSVDEPLRTRQANGSSSLWVTPAGTGVGAVNGISQRADPNNAARVYMQLDAGAAYITSDAVGSGTAVPLLIYTGGSERLRVTTAGQVGIGTNNPTATLDVNGSLLARGSLNAAIRTREFVRRLFRH